MKISSTFFLSFAPLVASFLLLWSVVDVDAKFAVTLRGSNDIQEEVNNGSHDKRDHLLTVASPSEKLLDVQQFVGRDEEDDELTTNVRRRLPSKSKSKKSGSKSKSKSDKSKGGSMSKSKSKKSGSKSKSKSEKSKGKGGSMSKSKSKKSGSKSKSKSDKSKGKGGSMSKSKSKKSGSKSKSKSMKSGGKGKGGSMSKSKSKKSGSKSKSKSKKSGSKSKSKKSGSKSKSAKRTAVLNGGGSAIDRLFVLEEEFIMSPASTTVSTVEQAEPQQEAAAANLLPIDPFLERPTTQIVSETVTTPATATTFTSSNPMLSRPNIVGTISTSSSESDMTTTSTGMARLALLDGMP